MATALKKRRLEDAGEASPAPAKHNGEKRKRSRSPTRQRTRIMKNGLPLHPLPAYNLWLEDTKKRIGADNIPKAAAQQSSFFAKEWHATSEDKKAKWEQKAAQEKIKWQREIAKFYDDNGFWHDEGVSGEERREKKEKKEKKEPRMLSGYNLYIKEHRKDDEFEGMESKVIMAELAKRWTALPDNEKEEYKTRAQEMGPVERVPRVRRSSKKGKEEEGDDEIGETEDEEGEEEEVAEEEVIEEEEAEEEE